ncbi:hypothetical protein MFRU_003g02130 [Monilinia fructicola]|nr:hypothetical protein MFRU_003g02130 [Monilinia fructicola]
MTSKKTKKQIRREKKIPVFQTHPFIEFLAEDSARAGSLRVVLNFTEEIKHSKETYDTFFEILPRYAQYTRNIYIGMVYRYSNGGEFTCKEARRRILAKVVKQINENFEPVSLHFVLHLCYISLENIISGCEIYGLKFPGWTFDILVDEVQHVEQGSFVDRYLRKEYEKGA